MWWPPIALVLAAAAPDTAPWTVAAVGVGLAVLGTAGAVLLRLCAPATSGDPRPEAEADVTAAAVPLPERRAA